MKYPWMPLFNGDLLAKTLHLSTQEFGAYMLLIIHAWTHRATIIVADAQRITRVSNRHWVKVRATLAPFFEPKDGLLGSTLEVVHSRVSEELANAGEISNKRKDAAMQMHANRRASASILHMHPPSQPIESLPNGKGRKAPAVQKQGMSRDQGNDYRSPPRAKSTNVLEPTHLVAAKRSASEE